MDTYNTIYILPLNIEAVTPAPERNNEPKPFNHRSYGMEDSFAVTLAEDQISACPLSV